METGQCNTGFVVIFIFYLSRLFKGAMGFVPAPFALCGN